MQCPKKHSRECGRRERGSWRIGPPIFAHDGGRHSDRRHAGALRGAPDERRSWSVRVNVRALFPHHTPTDDAECPLVGEEGNAVGIRKYAPSRTYIQKAYALTSAHICAPMRTRPSLVPGPRTLPRSSYRARSHERARATRSKERGAHKTGERNSRVIGAGQARSCAPERVRAGLGGTDDGVREGTVCGSPRLAADASRVAKRRKGRRPWPSSLRGYESSGSCPCVYAVAEVVRRYQASNKLPQSTSKKERGRSERRPSVRATCPPAKRCRQAHPRTESSAWGSA